LGWLYTITRNKIIDLYRKKKYEKVSLQESDAVSFDILLKDSGVDLEKDFIRAQVMEALIESLDELPDNQREVFIMQAMDGRTFKEIAELTDIPINTLITRKRYAVKFLRKRLADIKDVIQEIG